MTVDNKEKYHEFIRNKIINKIIILNNCWEYQGFINQDGYAMFNYYGVSRPAHRISYLCFVGEVINYLWVLHTCDNRKCVNPNHLYLGNHRDNTNDAIKRNRFHRGACPSKGHKGKDNTHAKLSENDVKKIRSMHVPGKFGAYKIAKIFHVEKSTILRILSRKTWKHI